MENLEFVKNSLKEDILHRQSDKILERNNAELLIKLINNADSVTEALAIAELGTTYKLTGLHFDKRLERLGTDIKYLKKNEALSIEGGENRPKHKLLIGDNYDCLLNLIVEFRHAIDVIYIDPPYAKDKMGEFATTNYENSISRDNLLSMLYPRLILARDLLTDDGVIICSIDDRNQSYVKCLFDEVFGESKFIFCAPRLMKKGGKTTTTIQKNHDYLLCYSMSDNPVFTQAEREEDTFTEEDEYVEKRGRFKLTQTLDYGSLSYSPSLDYEIEYEGRIFVPGSDRHAYEERKKGNYQSYDWTWRWNKKAFDWGVENGFVVLRGNRIYTKTYSKCRKKRNALEIEYVEGKAYTTLEFLEENKYSNDNGKKKLNEIFKDGERLFENPKPPALIENLISIVCDKDDAVILDFFAGSGTTGQAVLDFNRNNGTNYRFILCTNNEITDMNPNGIAYDVTTRRLKRIISGTDYDGNSDFKWIEDNSPFGDSLDVCEIETVSSMENDKEKNAFSVIDETLYGKKQFERLQDKIGWVCRNFDHTQRYIEE